MTSAEKYFETLSNILNEVVTTQREPIDAAARAVAAALENGHRIHAFGTGHSHMLAEELFYRAGGLVNVNPILEPSLMLHESASKSTELEREEGMGRRLFNSNNLRAGDVLFVFSNSGRNGVCIDLADIAGRNGVTVIVITNMKHTMSGASRHTSGKRLYEFGNIVIDNCGCVGDAAMEFDAGRIRTSPTSTAVGAAILNAVEAGAVEYMLSHGFEPELFSSSNVDGGDEINAAFIDKYRGEIKAL